MADLEGKWKPEMKLRRSFSSLEDNTPDSNCIWVVDSDGVATIEMVGGNSDGGHDERHQELVLSSRQLNMHETLNLHHSQDDVTGGWLIMRDDNYEIDAVQTDVDKNIIVWKRRKEFKELHMKREADIYEYEVWKRFSALLLDTTPEETVSALTTPEKKSSSNSTKFSALITKKRPSLNAMAGFSKVMKRGVLPKALANQIHSAVVAVEPKMTNILKEIAKQ